MQQLELSNMLDEVIDELADLKQQNAPTAELTALFLGLEPQAQSVLLDIAKRLKAGQAEYGVMDVFDGKRDYFAEAAEEAMDFVVYAAMQRLKLGGA